MDRVQNAFEVVERVKFVRPEYEKVSSADVPLPIGYFQTISQPTTVRLMLDWLDLDIKQKVLDVGSGSGWSTALLAYIVGDEGYVYGVEIVPELVEFGRKNIHRAGITNATIFQAGKKYGLQEYAPFDRILVSATAKEIPNDLKSQLKIGGKMVIPIGEDILELTRERRNKWHIIKHEGFLFVPLKKL